MTQQLAILVGASGGIGRAMAMELNRHGVSLILVGRNKRALEELSESLGKANPETANHAFTCDISCPEQRQFLLDFVESLEAKANLLINNVGINDFALFETQSDETVTELIQTNTLAPMLLTKLFMPYFGKQQKPAQVVNIGSIFGSIAYPGFAAYSASKFALRGATEALSREYADTQIRVRYFAPRATQTPFNSEAIIEMNKEMKVDTDSPEQVARAFWSFLQSNKVMGYLGWPEKLFVRINQIFPGLVSKELRKSLSIVRKYAAVSSR
jgi:short-subunit dehydrogenase